MQIKPTIFFVVTPTIAYKTRNKHAATATACQSGRSAVAGRSDRSSQLVQAAFNVPLLQKRGRSELSDALLRRLYEQL